MDIITLNGWVDYKSEEIKFLSFSHRTPYTAGLSSQKNLCSPNKGGNN